MFYQRDLSFLCDILQKSYVDVKVTDRRELVRLLAKAPSEDPFFIRDLSREIVFSFEERTVYHLTDSLSLSYRFLLLPETNPSALLMIGPYRASSLSPQQLLELGEKNGIPPNKQRYFTEYYETIPRIPADGSLWIMLDTFCERIWSSPSFSVKNLSGASAPSEQIHQGTASLSLPADTLVNMKAIERRYAFENEMIHAVEQGRSYMEDRLLSAFSASSFEKRLSDPLRNAKNYSIIMNTLLRKAAERGGVHPIYLDRLSSEFAAKIEGLPSSDANTALMGEMFRSYCHLVREHATRSLPPVVQQTVLLIDADLSADISPGDLAKSLGISPGYLSAVFKKAMGQTVSEYIRRRRMEHAAYLLETTNLQIQTVALHCGILDVQYFSKLFKKQMKLTPTQYRLTRQSSARES